MNSVDFVLPTLGTTAMSTNDQNRLVVNQATAAIVSGYLDHMNAAMVAGISTGGPNPNNFLAPTELVSLIDSVQAALS